LDDIALNDISHQFTVDYVAVAIVNETYNDFLTQLLLDAAVKRFVEQF
jgi:6,7-dimethyl-8-ribityllumazine synthase